MSIIKRISQRVHYHLDNIKVTALKVKIEHFILNNAHENIIVVYRLGRQKILNKMHLNQFEREYFEKISNFDQHRLTKFSTLQHILQVLFSSNKCNKEHFTHFIQEQVRHEQLF